MDFYASAAKLGIWFYVFTRPIHQAAVIVSVLVCADLFTGIYAAKKAGAEITSRGLRRTVDKLLGYLTAILLAHLTQQVTAVEISVLKAVAGFIAVTELLSNLENIGKIAELPLADSVRKLLNTNKPNAKN